MTASVFPLHFESGVTLNATPEIAFSYLDDFRMLSAHMETSTAMMMGSKMRITLDALEGRAVGSKVRMDGKIFGMTLSLEEVVMQRQPPLSKSWQTINAKLLVIGQYRLGFALSPSDGRSLLRVFIDYELPQHGLARWLGKLFGKMYARWCTEQMANDAAVHFNSATF
ncbi:SRPBCC family protein [Cupriavidus pinatubonensis]|uniref:SRPBCC family protein n=1 Tax=Cupriavidus pinatubonensis TaxID=248026 RepID=A0ABN7ZIL0_9BURK|nr:SRPBCC family protein [Cupriavidus pinatubonensis]CAG9183929.1 hypothetical protein LMG23994_05266 [Cupriavidus pinatubonensis]